MCSVTPLSNDNPSAVRDDSTGNPAMVIWRKYVDAGQSVTIPTTVAGWGGYIPLAPDGFTYDFSDAVVVLHQAVEIGGKTSSKAMADGYTAVKVDPLMVDEHAKRNPKHTGYGILPQFDLNMAVDRVTAIRETSPDLDIIIELHSFLSCNAAIQLAEKLRPLRIFYYEEPMHSMHVENMEQSGYMLLG